MVTLDSLTMSDSGMSASGPMTTLIAGCSPRSLARARASISGDMKRRRFPIHKILYHPLDLGQPLVAVFRWEYERVSMANYDWSKVSQQAYAELAIELMDDVDKGLMPTPKLRWKLELVKTQALVQPLRTRAEVNQELAELARLWIDDAGTSGNEVRWHKMQALRGEPTKD